MSKKQALTLVLTEAQEEKLGEFSRSKIKTIAIRAKIVLAVAGGASYPEAACKLHTDRQQVRKWAIRFYRENFEIFKEKRHGVPHKFAKILGSAVIDELKNAVAEKAKAGKKLSCNEASEVLGVSPASAHRWRDLFGSPRLIGKFGKVETTTIEPSRDRLGHPDLGLRLNELAGCLLLDAAVSSANVAQLRAEIFAPIIRHHRKLFGDIRSEELQRSLCLAQPTPEQVVVRKARHLRFYKSRALCAERLENNFIDAILGTPGTKLALITPIEAKPWHSDRKCKPGSFFGAVLTLVVRDKSYPVLWRSLEPDRYCPQTYFQVVAQLLGVFSKQTGGRIPAFVDVPFFLEAPSAVLGADWFAQFDLPTLVSAGDKFQSASLAVRRGKAPIASRLVPLAQVKEAMALGKPHKLGVDDDQIIIDDEMIIWPIPLPGPNPSANCLAVYTKENSFFLGLGSPEFVQTKLAPLRVAQHEHDQVIGLMMKYLGLKKGRYVSGPAWEKRKLVASLSWWLCQKLELFTSVEKKLKRLSTPLGSNRSIEIF